MGSQRGERVPSQGRSLFSGLRETPAATQRVLQSSQLPETQRGVRVPGLLQTGASLPPTALSIA